MWDSSACWLFIYFKRAGVLKKRSSTLILVPLGQLLGSTVSISPPWAIKRVPCVPPFVAVSIVKRETEAIDGSASPRKPNVRIRKRSACFLILLVACRRKAKETSSCSIPSPLSMTWILLSPASSISTIIWVAPASMEFSINSLTTLLGRSMTSPAAIWLARFSGNSIIFDIVFGFTLSKRWFNKVLMMFTPIKNTICSPFCGLKGANSFLKVSYCFFFFVSW